MGPKEYLIASLKQESIVIHNNNNHSLTCDTVKYYQNNQSTVGPTIAKPDQNAIVLIQ